MDGDAGGIVDIAAIVFETVRSQGGGWRIGNISEAVGAALAQEIQAEVEAPRETLLEPGAPVLLARSFEVPVADNE